MKNSKEHGGNAVLFFCAAIFEDWMSFQKVPDFRKFLDRIPKSVEKIDFFGFRLSDAFSLYARDIDAGWRKM